MTTATLPDSQGLEVDAAEIRIRAERRLGEMMADQKAAGQMSTGAQGVGSNQHQVRVADGPAPITLAEAGIDKHLADRDDGLSLWLVKDRNEAGGILGVHLRRDDAFGDRDAHRGTYRTDEDGRKIPTRAYVEKVKATFHVVGEVRS